MIARLSEDVMAELTRLRQQAGSPTCVDIAAGIDGTCSAPTIERLFSGTAAATAATTATVAAVISLLRRLASKRGNPTPEISAQLSDTQVRILRLLAQGHTNAEIAKALHGSSHTVRVHLKHVFRVLGARNRAHAVAIARDHGFALPVRHGPPCPGSSLAQ